MALTSRITVSMFLGAFHKAGREEQFSHYALAALHEYYEKLSEELGEDIELDVIGICCEWAEYDDLDAIKEDYGNPFHADALSAAQSFAEAADALGDKHDVLRISPPTRDALFGPTQSLLIATD